MTKIYGVKSKIEDLQITVGKSITIQVLNFLDSFFAQFFGFFSQKAKEKRKLPALESLDKCIEDGELRMKNHDKAKANYAKQLIMKKEKPSTRSEDTEDSATGFISRCKFY